MRTLRFRFSLAVVLSVVALGTSNASAQDHADFNKAVEAGNKLYVAKDYAKAADKYVYAYTIRPEPMLLFNAAQCFRKLKKNADAIKYYKRFLKTPPPDPLPRSLDAARKAAKQWIEALSAKPAKTGTNPKTGTGGEAKTVTTTKPDATPPNPSVETPKAGTGTGAGTGTETGAGTGAGTETGAGTGAGSGTETGVATTAPGKPDGKRKLAWVSFGVGGAGLVGAGVFALLATRAVDEKNENPTQANADKVERWELLTNISWGVAIAGAATGVALYLLSRPKKSERKTSLTVTPLDRGGAAAVVFGRF